MNLNSFDFFKKLKQQPFVDRIILYGSRARHDELERSDIDFAIECPLASESDWLVILKIIEEADTLLKIDCVRLDSLSKQDLLFQKINQDGVLVYAKQ